MTASSDMPSEVERRCDDRDFRVETTPIKRPNFFILGGPKCGTTALAQWLGENPRIYMSPVKEPHYYSDFHNRYTTDKGKYLELFANATSAHLVIGEASVWHLYSPNAAQKILHDTPDAKFIVCLRNPVEMAYSLHGQTVVSGDENIKDFRSAWRAQRWRARSGKGPRMCRDYHLLLYGPACCLGTQYSRLLEIVPKQRVVTVLLDDVRENPAASYRKVLGFLGVPDDGRAQFNVVNSAKQRHYPRLHRAIEKLYLMRKRWHIPRTHLGMALIPFHRWNLRASTRPPLDKDMQSELRQYFMPEIETLERLLGRDLSAWKGDMSDQSSTQRQSQDSTHCP